MSRAVIGDVFLYFAYGSNMLMKRIQLRNRSAVYRSPARLADYKLRFGYYNDTWHGHVASIAQCQGADTWGVLWEMKLEDLESLDKQEGVSQGIYRRIELAVHTKDGQRFWCYAYKLTKNDELHTMPSPHYKQVMVLGATEHSLPEHYIAWLKSLPDNAYTGRVAIYEELALA